MDPGVTPRHETRGVDDSADGGWHDIERASYRTGVKGLESKDWVVWLVWWVYACQTTRSFNSKEIALKGTVPFNAICRNGSVGSGLSAKCSQKERPA